MLDNGLCRLTLKRAFSDGTVAIELDPLSLLCRLAASVPAPGFNTVRYAGVLAPAAHFRALILAPSIKTKSSQRRSGWRPWAELPQAQLRCRAALPAPQCDHEAQVLCHQTQQPVPPAHRSGPADPDPGQGARAGNAQRSERKSRHEQAAPPMAATAHGRDRAYRRVTAPTSPRPASGAIRRGSVRYTPCLCQDGPLARARALRSGERRLLLLALAWYYGGQPGEPRDVHVRLAEPKRTIA